MDEIQQEMLRTEAEQCIRAHPECRILSFTWNGETYWIKRKQGNHRKRYAKYSVEKEFYYEVAHITVAARSVDSAPDIVVLTDTYMVLRDGGCNVKDWLLSAASDEEKCFMLRKAGAALSALHQAGLYHGRPAIRDMAWNGEKITLLDWENKTIYPDLLRRQITDILLLFQGMYRENWMNGKFVEAAWAGYEDVGGAPLLWEACQFVHSHPMIYALCRMLHPFHFKDVESAEKVCRWFGKKYKQMKDGGNAGV